MLLLDIEGTTTPVDFVYDTLFPYARTRLRAFLASQSAQPDVASDIAGLRSEHAADTQKGAAPPPWPGRPAQAAEHAATYALWLMDQDRKSTPLKSLQGRIWRAGYEGGELHGPLYSDVPRAIERWKRQGRRVAIFSSGSVQAQKLLFRHSEAGDLTPLLDGYFDTTTGPKREAQAYRAIAKTLATPPDSVMFLSDVEAELDAARAAGMETVLCVRPGESGEDSSSGHPVAHDFDGIFP